MCQFIKLKWCYSCTKWKFITSFNKNKSRKDGAADECRECSKLKGKQYYIQNSAKIKANVRKWEKENNGRVNEWARNDRIKNKERYLIKENKYRELNKDKITQYKHEWYKKNKKFHAENGKNWRKIHTEEVKQYSKKYRDTHKKQRNEYNSKWRKENPDIYKVTTSKRRKYGFAALNKPFKDSNGHHLHLENNDNFAIYIPAFLHEMHFHNPDTLQGIDTINAIALDFLVNEYLYYDLYGLNRSDDVSSNNEHVIGHYVNNGSIKDQMNKKRQNDCGLDLKCDLSKPIELYTKAGKIIIEDPDLNEIILPPFSRIILNTSLNIAIPYGYAGLICDRSGLAAKNGITILAGIVDSDYVGDIKVVMFNSSWEEYIIYNHDRIAQLLTVYVNLNKYIKVKSLEETDRGNAGFGSSGR